MTRHHIGLRELFSLAVICISSKIFLALPQQWSAAAATGAWLVPLIAAIYGPIIWIAIRAVIRAAPGATLIEGTEVILGPWIGTLVNLCYALYHLLLVTLVAEQFALDIRMLFLPATPTVVLGLMTLGLAAYLVYEGLEALARVASLFGPILLIGLFLLLVGGLATHKEVGALYPLWGNGLPSLLITSLSQGALYSEILLLGLIANNLRSDRQLNQVAWLSLGASVLLLTGTMLTIQHVFPHPSLSHLSYPVLQMSQIVSVGPIAQRMESLFVLVWVIALLLKVGCGLYGVVIILARTLRIPHSRWLIFPVVWLVNALASIPVDDQTLAQLDLMGIRVAGTGVVVLLPVITAMIGWFRGRRGATHG